MAEKQGRKEAYIARVSRGEGFMPWQKKERTSPEKRAFREAMEFSGPVRMSDVEEVQLRVVQTVRQLGEAGQVTVTRGETQDVFV